MKVYNCSRASIDICSEDINLFLEKSKVKPNIAISTRLLAETLLLNWVEQTTVDSSFTFETYKFLGQQHLIFTLKGERLKPLPKEDQDEFLQLILSNIDAVFAEEYKKGINIVDIKLPRPDLGNNGKVALAIGSALVLGNIMNACLPADMVKIIADDYVGPMFSSIIGILNAFVAFMIFFSIVASILGMGNVSVLKNIGFKYFKQVFFNTSLWTAVCLPISVVCFITCLKRLWALLFPCPSLWAWLV